MDFALTSSLDLMDEDNTLQEQTNGETTMLQAFFTDARIDGKRGYWLDIPQSDIWQYEQKRLNTDTLNDLNESAREIAKQLVVVGVYERIETNGTFENDVLTLQIKAFDKKRLVFDKKFAV